MITDAQTLLSDAQAITADAASTNYYDTGAAADIGGGNPLRLSVTLDESFNTLTSLDFILQCDDNSSFSSAKDLYKVNYLLASLTAGATINLPSIPNGAERYIRLYYDVNGSNPSTGKISARILLDNQRNTPTADLL